MGRRDMLRRKTAAAVEILPQFFCFGGEQNMSNEASMVLTKAEKRLVEVIRALDYGEVRVMIKDSHPIRVDEIRRSIQLPSDK
jgi:hypothetical protein